MDQKDLIQSLKDCGCDQRQIDLFLDNEKDQKKILRLQRCALLEEFHCTQKKLDCLDYLVHQITKETK